MWDEDILVEPRNNGTSTNENRLFNNFFFSLCNEQNQEKNKKPILVIDTNAFIKCLDLKSLHDKYDLYTTAEVKYEIRDKKAREKFSALPFEINVKDPSKTGMAAVKKFAIATGDIATLSSIDQNVIALCYTVAEENKTVNLIRKEPPQILEAFAAKQNIESGMESLTLEEQANQNPELSSKTQEEEEDEEGSFEDVQEDDNEDKQEDDGWNVVPVKEKKQQNNKQRDAFGNGWNYLPQKQKGEEKQTQDVNQQAIAKETEQICDQVLQKNEEIQEQKENKVQENKNVEESDDEDDGEGWINENNLHLYKEQGSKKLEIDSDKLGISIMTADYAMQNVALQMGIPLVSVDGMLITRTKRFILECFSCLNLCKDMTKKFCPKCCNHSLLKVSCSVEADGTIKLYRKKGFKLNTNGFIYSIPNPKIGKNANNLVLREDELMKGNKLTQMKIAQKQQEKEFNRNMLEFENGFTLGDVKHKQHHNNELDFGYGRTNPNNVSQMKRHRRK